MKKCFVVTPIGGEGSDTRKRADQVFKYIIGPTCKICGFEAIRVDQINQADSITQTIIDMLGSAELVIADMTGHNPNAFYEMGYRACTGRPMINLKQKGESIPFDIANIRAFDYDLSDLDSVEEVKQRLEQTIRALNITEESTKDDIVADNDETAKTEKESGAVDYLPVLYDIQDQISHLREEIHIKDTETIHAIIKASQQPAVVEDPNITVMKALLPELIKNPDSFKAIMELSEKAKKTESKK